MAHQKETEEIFYKQWQALYDSSSPDTLFLLYEVLSPHADVIIERLLSWMEERAVNVCATPTTSTKQVAWLKGLFSPQAGQTLREFIRAQMRVGNAHAQNNVPMRIFDEATRRLRTDLSTRLTEAEQVPRAQLGEAIALMNNLVDLSTALMSESFYTDMVRAGSEHLTTEALRNTLALVLAGGRGQRLGHLTERRAKPATPFGGMFRVIDFPLSNCINSGIRRIGVLSQYESHILMQHVQRGWNFLRADLNEFVELWPAQQQAGSAAWYEGTADAVYQNLRLIAEQEADHILILAGDHVYRQDYSKVLREHLDRDAVATVACIEVPIERASGFGVMDTDGEGNVIQFLEKPAKPPAIPGRPELALASMGIYLFDADFLIDLLERDAFDAKSSHDFGNDILPRLVEEGSLKAHRFSKSCVVNPGVDKLYWRDVGTIDAYWEANLDLTSVVPSLDLYDERWPIRTFQERRPPAKFVFDETHRRGTAVGSLISAGCIVSGSTVRRSLLGTDVHVHSYCLIEDSVIMGDTEINRGCRLRRTIVDTYCRLPPNLIVGEDPEADARRFHRTPGGIILITRSMLEAL
jgi:glucose-1-phosphate adenylyltransferase